MREIANLHGFPPSYCFLGPLNERYDIVIDSVMPHMARAIGLAINDYLAALTALAEPPRSLGYREVLSPNRKRQQMEESLTILREPNQVDWQNWPKNAQQMPLWS